MRIAAALLLVLLLGGCARLGYYLQAAGGQLEIWQREVPVERLLADPVLDPKLRLQLERALRIRDFASRELGLPDNRSYRAYADLARPFVVWNVFAAPELSLQAKQWCFAFAGCVNYRGYFNEADARAEAARLTAQSYDVHVGGVPAYSTLGWFADPLLNTFIHYPEPELARLIFHELAHQQVYVQDDTVFNESFATVVEQAGVERWLAAHGSAGEREQFDRLQRFRADFRRLVAEAREDLSRLYAGTGSDEEKRRLKAEAFARLRKAYQAQRSDWGGFAGFDRWFAQSLGNAHLASVAIYTQRVPALTALLRQCADDLTCFYTAVRELAALQPAQRRQRLDALAPLLP